MAAGSGAYDHTLPSPDVKGPGLSPPIRPACSSVYPSKVISSLQQLDLGQREGYANDCLMIAELRGHPMRPLTARLRCWFTLKSCNGNVGGMATQVAGC